MMRMIDDLLAAQAELAKLPVDTILARLDRVVERWLDPANALRREALERLSESTRLAPTMLQVGLDQTLSRIRGLGALLDGDLGSRYHLDRFVERYSGECGSVSSRAYGPGLLTCVFAGNVPGVPAFDMALSLALKSACLARPASGEPHFAGLFARSVAEIDPLLGRCLAVHSWGYEDRWPYERAGAVLVYGSDASVDGVRKLVPAGVRFVPHGHKVSFAMVAREAAQAETARLLAWDVAMYDQQGCVSPHLCYVERGGPLTPMAFAAAVGEALAGLHEQMPRAPLIPQEAAALRSVRDEAEFAASGCFASPTGLDWAVIHQEAPAFEPSPLNRLVRTYGVDDLEQALEWVLPVGPLLQTVGFAGPAARRVAIAEAVGQLGASRVTTIGAVQTLHPLWRHDGRPTAGDLVRWVEIC